jgi:hypothetical protein
MKTSSITIENARICFLLIVLITLPYLLQAQSIRGTITDGTLPVAYASVALFDAETLMGGTISNEEGTFGLDVPTPAHYTLRISSIGYQALKVDINALTGETIELGEIRLQPADYLLDQVTIEGMLVKGKAEQDKSTYLINSTMQSASSSGTDILKLIPGIGVDIMQKISLDGSSAIVILVNGRERDPGYVRQLRASQIDRVEVITSPSARYDASASGVINIILRSDAGLQGQVSGELPLSTSEMFLFPSAGVSYGKGKVNLFTSWSGELIRFDVEDNYRRTYNGGSWQSSRQHVKQNTRSHRINLGADYQVNENNQLSLYTYYNPFSQHNKGDITLSRGESTNNAGYEDTDLSTTLSVTAFYKHTINRGHEITAETSIHRYDGTATTRVSDHDFISRVKPRQQEITARMDYRRSLGNNFRLMAGTQVRQREMGDAEREGYHYYNGVLAMYGSLGYTGEKTEVVAGVRYEGHGGGDSIIMTEQTLLPNVSVSYRITDKQRVTLTHRSSVHYPGVYQLNPTLTFDDPYTTHQGNPLLTPATQNTTAVEYSRQLDNHFFATRAFYTHTGDVINVVMQPDDQGIFHGLLHNAGDITRMGGQVWGTFSLGTRGGLQPSVKISESHTTPNETGKLLGLEDRRQVVVELVLSLYFKLSENMTLALRYQYASPENQLQSTRYSGAQYFLTAERSLGKHFSVGLVSALPLQGRYTYQGSDITQNDFSSYSSGQLNISTVPLWVKFSYRFSSGADRKRVDMPQVKTERRREGVL